MSTKIVKKLTRARERTVPVRVRRGNLKKGTDVIHGVIVAIGPDWVVVSAMDDSVYFDGWHALRLDDITAVVSDDGDFEEYFARAVAAHGSGPELPAWIGEAVAARRTKALMQLVMGADLCGLYMEADWPDELYIGSFLGRREKKRFAFDRIDPAGNWWDRASVFPARRITRVTIGGRYLDALVQFGEPVPNARLHGE
ncbi:hypothetical protein [Glaciihabitans sp. dw_435]|uniref:hypothetical protein n=1 Tax=Glaciihabitans sp. dw_435 TaxID=2720081 RepID=UPI001BD29F5F|nr:hypothetical protein [Glaciihabitans sp. dw_435]